ncbi:dessication-induced 1VOC superfamily protein [Actinidia rufa]|uniref:Dessication-induced 1VOC superfamily protein n=1 Tax=Actinidia rufa TaxID=165716 RepID=A0A7J0DL39_9ERIC|nr:dessication-induced 1VOC superfamily protein [Actinidia rufa]
MASTTLKPAFAYAVVYVKDVAKSVAFYAKAFGYGVRRLDESHRYNYAKLYTLKCEYVHPPYICVGVADGGELESGQTTIAFTPLHQHETDGLTGSVQVAGSGHVRNQVEICFDYPDVIAAYKRAVENGVVPVSEPEEKEWGQKVGYVRDMDGNVVRMGSYVYVGQFK